MARLAFKLSTALVASAVWLGAPAEAQDAGQTAAPASQPPGGAGYQPNTAGVPSESTGLGQLETIVVTAQKRTQDVQHIAAPIASVSEATLTRADVKDIDNVNKVLPDVRVDNVVGATNIAIRGIRASSVGSTSDSPAAIHLDGIYLARPSGLSGYFYDISRIEELPGPQGTLYGRNATSGVLNIIPNHPTGTLGGYVEAEGGNYATHRIEGAINLPVSDSLAIRVAARDYHHDGYFSNGQSDQDETGIRASARAKLAPTVTLLVSGDYERTHDHGIGSALVGETYGSPPNGPPPQFPTPPLAYPIPSNPFHTSSILYPYGVDLSRDRSKAYGGMAQLDIDLGKATWTTQVGGRWLRAESDIVNQSACSPPSPFGPPPAPGSGGDCPAGYFPPAPDAVGYVHAPQHSRTLSAETRIASSQQHQALQYVVGLFYFNEHDVGEFCSRPSFTSTACTLQLDNHFQHTNSYAIFGDLTFSPEALGGNVHFTGGARYNYEHKEGDASFITPAVINVMPDIKQTFKKVTYKAEVSADLTPRNLIYAQFSTGFRSGGIAYGSQPIFRPETIDAYEIGSKNRFFDDKLQVNLSGYHYVYRGIVINVLSVGPLPPPAFFGLTDLTVANIGKAEYTGASATADFAATPDDRLSLNLQYLHGKYDDYVIPARFAASPPLDLMGNPTGQPAGVATGLPVANTPRWTGTASYDHGFDALGGRFDARVATQFSTKRDFTTNPPYPKNTIQYQFGETRGFVRVDLSLSYTHKNFELTGYVNNVANRRDYSNVGYEGQNITGSGLIVANLMQPRTFGAILSARF